MKEELTTAMHSEFTISEATEREHRAIAIFQLMAAGAGQELAMRGMGLTVEELRSYLPLWSRLSSKQIVLE